MESIAKISLKFGTPEFGWLPIKFKYQNFNLALDVSDVPVNPINQLCTCLIQINKGIKFPQIIVWHLEPRCYYLQLEKNDNNFNVKILESESLDSQMDLLIKFTGDFENIILPLYRGLKEFSSHLYSHPNWEIVNNERVEELTRLIKKNRT